VVPRVLIAGRELYAWEPRIVPLLNLSLYVTVPSTLGLVLIFTPWRQLTTLNLKTVRSL